MDIGKRIKKFRLDVNMTQDELGLLLGVKKNTISNWETGRSSPDVNYLPQICSILGITATDLLDINADPLNLASSEYKHIQKYRALDERGRRNVNVILNAEYEHTHKTPTKSEDIQPDIEFDDVMFLDEYGNRMIAPVTPEIKETAMRALKEHAEKESKRASETTDDASSQ